MSAILIRLDFPSFWEGLSLRRQYEADHHTVVVVISLPFGRDFH